MLRYYAEDAGAGPILVTDTVTILEPGDAGAVIVSGSHGGISSAQFVLGRVLRGVFYNDAGVGKDAAGIAALGVLDGQNCPAATIDYRSARIGDAEDTWRNGIVSHANAVAQGRGLRSGMTARHAAALLSAAAAVDLGGASAGPVLEPRLQRREVSRGASRLLLLDSISMLQPSDAGRFVLSGSHGGAVSGEFALRHRPGIAVFNDAGVGRDEAGIAALGVLQGGNIPAAAVGCQSGRIGDPEDMLEGGVVTHVNEAAQKLGLVPGQSVAEQLFSLPGLASLSA